jgi:hypothetical protein
METKKKQIFDWRNEFRDRLVSEKKYFFGLFLNCLLYGTSISCRILEYSTFRDEFL